MTTNRTMLKTLGVLVVGGTMLLGTSSVLADRPSQGGRGDDRGGYSQRNDDRRGNDRGRDNDRREYDRGRDNDRSGVRFGVSYGAPAVVYRPVYTPVYTTTYSSTTQVWIPESYTVQTQNVLVEPAHWEWVTMPAVTETRYPSNGVPYTVVISPARQERVWVADRYEARQVRVLVPGRWETVTTSYPVPAPVIVQPQPRTTISIGGIFRF